MTGDELYRNEFGISPPKSEYYIPVKEFVDEFTEKSTALWKENNAKSVVSFEASGQQFQELMKYAILLRRQEVFGVCVFFFPKSLRCFLVIGYYICARCSFHQIAAI